MKTYTPPELRELAESRRTNPFFIDQVIAALHYAANVLEAADAAVTAERQRAEQSAKDAARYQWLRDPQNAVGLVLDKVVEGGPPDGFIGGDYRSYEYRAGAELDAAVDAAILASKATAAGEGK